MKDMKFIDWLGESLKEYNVGIYNPLSMLFTSNCKEVTNSKRTLII